MLIELEAAILKKLNDNGIETIIFDPREEIPRHKIAIPHVFCSIEEADFKPSTMGSFYQEVSIFLVVTFKNLKNEAERRKGIYPVLEGIVGLLMLQNLGIGIHPLSPISFKNITDEHDAKNGEIIFSLEFRTKYTVTPTDESEAVELLTLGLKYYLQEPVDDGVEDSESIVGLSS